MEKNTVITATGFDACFYHTFYRAAFTLHGHVFYVTGARCRDFMWAYVPPAHMRPPCRCVNRWCASIRPVRFPVANPRAPPPTTIQDRVCPDTDVGVAPCVCGKSRNHGRCNRRGGNRNPRSTPHVMAMWSRTRCGAEDWNRQSLFLILQIWSFTLFGDFIFVDLSALEIRRRSSLSLRAKLSLFSGKS